MGPGQGIGNRNRTGNKNRHSKQGTGTVMQEREWYRDKESGMGQGSGTGPGVNQCRIPQGAGMALDKARFNPRIAAGIGAGKDLSGSVQSSPCHGRRHGTE